MESCTQCQAMESCPKANIDGFKDILREENLYLITEVTELKVGAQMD